MERYILAVAGVDIQLLDLNCCLSLDCEVATVPAPVPVLGFASGSDSEDGIELAVGLSKTVSVPVPSQSPSSPSAPGSQLLSMVSSLNRARNWTPYSHFQQRGQPRSQVVLEAAPSESCSLVTGLELESLGTKRDSFR